MNARRFSCGVWPEGLRPAALSLACVLGGVLTLTGCGRPAPPTPAAPVPEVRVLTVATTQTQLPMDLVAEVKAMQEVEIRPRASGLVVKQFFQPGQRVKAGDLLFQIDAKAYDEGQTDAQAKLAEAEAQLAKARQDLTRYEPLVRQGIIPRVTYDQAVAQEKSSAAVVQARKAGLERARLDRSYTEVRSPIAGQIGLQKAEAGSLATAGQTVMATVSSLSPMVAYFSVSETDYLAYMKRLKDTSPQGRKESAAQHPVQLVLADGSVYAAEGAVDFADRALNAATGTLTLRAVFPNTDELLRPGMNARVRVVADVAQSAILIPQRAVSEMLGKQFVTVIGAENKAQQQPIRTGRRLGDQWLVLEGLKPGDVIVVDGLQKARPGVVVKPVPLADQPQPPAGVASEVASGATAGANAGASTGAAAASAAR
jgi:membrane fusion protein (multidrug efflux system)